MKQNQIYMIMSIEYGYLGELTVKDAGLSLFLLRHIETYKYPSYLGLLAKKGQYFFEHDDAMEWIRRRTERVLSDSMLVQKYGLSGHDPLAAFFKLKGESTLDDVYITPKLSAAPTNLKTRARR